MSPVCGVYAIRNAASGKTYVGQSVNIKSRWASHRKMLGRGRKSALYEAIKKHGLESFEFEVLEECSPEELNDKEACWMDKLQTRTEGYNILPAGQIGRVMDEAARKAISDRLRGRKRPAEVVEKIRRAMLGKKHSDATKKKLSQIVTGRVTSEETKQKLAQAQRRAHLAKGHTVKAMQPCN
jgi:group I intron endonuclease